MADWPKVEQTYDLSLLQRSQRKWQQSKGLRVVYESIYLQIKKQLVPGHVLELGSGIAGIKAYIPDVVTSDLVKTPYVAMECSAYDIPPVYQRTGEPWSGIIAVDVLHHLCRPLDFLASAAFALRNGGKIILVEPAGTCFGRIFYGLFHPEPVLPQLVKPPFVFEAEQHTGEFANMAMARELFVTHQEFIKDWLGSNGLALSEVWYRDLLAYPLSGGYSSPQLMPATIINGLLNLEGFIPQWVIQRIALRMLVVLTKV